MTEKPIDGYVRMITMALSMMLTVVLMFVTDPAKAETITQFWNALLIPAVPFVAGTIFTIVRTITDGQKIEAKKELMLAGIMPVSAPAGDGKASATVAPRPSQAPVLIQAATVPALWAYADVNTIADEIKQKLGKDELSAAYAFYNRMLDFDLLKVQPKMRVQQATEWIKKCEDLFFKGWKYYTQLEVPPMAEFANKAKVMFKVKQDYEKANNMVCSNKTFDEILNLIGMIDDFQMWDQGLDLVGTNSEGLDWGTFGGGRPVNPLDVAIYASSLNKNPAVKGKKDS